MTKNGNENGEKTKPERDERGRFIRGCSPGPGRSVRAKKPISLAKIEESLRSDLESSDPKIRQGAAKILLALRKAGLNDDGETITLLDPRLQRFLGVAMSGILDDPDVIEVDVCEDD